MDMAPPNSRMIFQGMVSMSSTSRVRERKKSTVATIMMAARSMFLKKGMGEKDFIMNRNKTTATMAITNFSFLFMGPSSFPRLATRSRKPSMRALSGLKQKITVSQMKKTMMTPKGSMYQERVKKPISVPPVNFWCLSSWGGLDYSYETDAFALPAEPPPQVQLGKECRAMVLSWTLRRGVKLEQVALETLSQEVVIGLMGLSLMNPGN